MDTVWPARIASRGAGQPQQLIECESVEFIKAVVAGSDSLAFLPDHAVITDVVAGRLRPLDFGAAELGRDIAVVFRERSPLQAVSRELVDEIEAVPSGLAPSPLANQDWPGYSAGPSWRGGLGWGALGAGRGR